SSVPSVPSNKPVLASSTDGGRAASAVTGTPAMGVAAPSDAFEFSFDFAAFAAAFAFATHRSSSTLWYSAANLTALSRLVNSLPETKAIERARHHSRYEQRHYRPYSPATYPCESVERGDV